MTIRLACLTVKQYTGRKCCLRIRNTKMYTVNKNRIAMNIDDDKSLIMVDGITTLVRGYLAPSV